MAAKPVLLVISQVYVPDPASVGQHMADVAETMARRGYRVRVLTSRRGYDDPSEQFAARETRYGVEIKRLPWSSFGKRSLVHRLAGHALYLLQVIMHGLFAPNLCQILVSTSPPMASFAALVIGYVRRTPISYWVMDLNPDQAIALGKVRAGNLATRALKWLNARIFARAAQVIVLDRFMAERIQRQYKVLGRLEILPPWPHDECAKTGGHDNPFQMTHNPDGRFVVMYSGNHSLASPVTTMVEAALRLRDDPQFLFMFIGGGHGKREVDEAIAANGAKNFVSLPYQPLEQLHLSLSTADVHVVTLGSDMVGIVHPCKVYGALAVGRPILYVGPTPSHISDLLDLSSVGWHVEQGDIDGFVEHLRRAIAIPTDDRENLGRQATKVIAEKFSKTSLCEAFCDLIDRRRSVASPLGAPSPEEFAA